MAGSLGTVAVVSRRDTKAASSCHFRSESGVGQHVPTEIGGAVSGLKQDLQIASGPVLGPELVAYQIGRAQDAAENVVSEYYAIHETDRLHA